MANKARKRRNQRIRNRNSRPERLLFRTAAERFKNLQRRLTYKDGYKFHRHEVPILNINGDFVSNQEEISVGISTFTPNVDTVDQEITLYGNSTRLKMSETDEEWLHKLWSLIKELEDHERDEFFQLDGRKVYDPHKPVFQKI